MCRKVLIYVVALLGILACSEHLEEGFTGVVVGDKVCLSVSLDIPEIPMGVSSTRALGENPQLENLYLAVFDASGYLLEYVKADAQQATENEINYTYSAALTPTQTAREVMVAPVMASRVPPSLETATLPD